MKKLLVAGIIAAMPVVMMANDDMSQGDVTGNVNLFVGQKTLEKDDWKPLEKQTEVGIMFDIGGKDWPVNIALDILVSTDEDTISGVNIEATMTEFDIGIRKSFLDGNFHPQIGGGLAFINAELKGTYLGPTVSDDDTGVGFWASGGLYYSIIQHINVGLDLRYSYAKGTLFDVEGDSGGTHIGVFAGYHW